MLFEHWIYSVAIAILVGMVLRIEKCCLLVGVVLVVLAAMLRTAYEGAGWVTRSMPAITR